MAKLNDVTHQAKSLKKLKNIRKNRIALKKLGLTV